MSNTMAIVLAIIASTGFWELIKYIIQLKSTSHSVTEEALLGLLHDKLQYLCSRSLSEGEISINEFANIKQLYVPYRRLGGNGDIETMYSQVEKLPMTMKKREYS